MGLKARIEKTESGGVITFRVAEEDRRMALAFLRRELKRAEPDADGGNIPLVDLTMKRWHKHRTENQNGLYWGLVGILAFEAYGEHGHEDEAHEELLRMYAPLVEGKIGKEQVPMRSRDMTTAEFHALMEGTFHELAERGLEGADAIDVWLRYKTWHTIRGEMDADPVRHTTPEEYRAATVICEACGKPGEHIAHIVSRGAGGDDTSDNLLLLCVDCHIGIQHSNGWARLIEKAPHLAGKIKRAQGGRNENER